MISLIAKILDGINPKLPERECIVLSSQPCRDSQILLGQSKLGGSPDLPPDFANLSEESSIIHELLSVSSLKSGRVKHFVGQINFQEIEAISNRLWNALSLPTNGLLSIFLLEDADNILLPRILYFPDAKNLQRVLLKSVPHPCHPSKLTPHHWLTVPPHLPQADTRDVHGHKLSDEELAVNLASYANMNRLLNNAFLEWFYPEKDRFEFDTPWHQMLGFSRDIALRGKQKDSYTDTSKDWQLLAQIDSDSIISLSWGYQGQLYFWIRKEDLLACDFARVEVELAQTSSKP